MHQITCINHKLGYVAKLIDWRLKKSRHIAKKEIVEYLKVIAIRLNLNYNSLSQVAQLPEDSPHIDYPCFAGQ